MTPCICPVMQIFWTEARFSCDSSFIHDCVVASMAAASCSNPELPRLLLMSAFVDLEIVATCVPSFTMHTLTDVVPRSIPMYVNIFD